MLWWMDCNYITCLLHSDAYNNITLIIILNTKMCAGHLGKLKECPCIANIKKFRNLSKEFN